MPRKSRKAPSDPLQYTWSRWQRGSWTISIYPSWEALLEASYNAFIAGSCVTGVLNDQAKPRTELSHPGIPHFLGSVHSGPEDRLMEAWDAWLEDHPDKRLDEQGMTRE